MRQDLLGPFYVRCDHFIEGHWAIEGEKEWPSRFYHITCYFASIPSKYTLSHEHAIGAGRREARAHVTPHQPVNVDETN